MGGSPSISRLPVTGWHLQSDRRSQQLNASINYDITDNINVGIEGINLTGSDANQFCVNNKALLCFQGLTDRRLTAGVSVKF